MLKKIGVLILDVSAYIIAFELVSNFWLAIAISLAFMLFHLWLYPFMVFSGLPLSIIATVISFNHYPIGLSILLCAGCIFQLFVFIGAIGIHRDLRKG